MLEMLHGTIGGGVITPKLPDYSGPGPQTLMGGDENAGFYGEIPTNQFITGDALATAIGLSAGAPQNSTIPWLKFNLDGKTLFIAKNSFRHTISWNHINAANAVYGGKTIDIAGDTYKVRLIKGANTDPTTAVHGTIDDPQTHTSEWNRLIYPICIENPTYPKTSQVGPNWVNYIEAQLNITSASGNGSVTWCQEKISTNAVTRGYATVTFLFGYSLLYAGADIGWRPCLELVP